MRSPLFPALISSRVFEICLPTAVLEAGLEGVCNNFLITDKETHKLAFVFQNIYYRVDAHLLSYVAEYVR